MNWRRASRAAGLACIALGAIGLASDLASSSEDVVARAIGAPTPRPSVAPASVVRGGAIAVTITGNVIAGGSFASGVTGAQRGTVSAAGAVIDLARRTPNTAFDVTIPTAFSSHFANVGGINAEFDTPHSSYTFGSQAIGAIGLVPAGSTARGPGVIFPRPHGDLTFYGGVAGSTPTFLVRGARLRTIGRSGVSTLALYDASTHEGGRVDGALFGLVSRPARVSGEIELGIERHRHLGFDGSNPIADGTGFALNARLDAGGSKTYASLNIREISPNYVALGNIAQADRDAALSFRSRLGNAPYTAIIEDDRVGGSGSIADTRRQSFSIDAPLARAGTAIFTVGNSTTVLPNDRSWTGNLGASLTYPVRGFLLSAAADANRSTDVSGSPNAATNVQVGIARTLGAFALASQFSYARSISPASTDTAPTLSLTASHASGKTTYTLTTLVGRQFQSDSALSFVTPSLGISRRLSSVFVASANAALHFRHDSLQPASNGRTTQLSFSLGAPFAIGNGIVSGRPNPRLPGTIAGVVQTELSSGVAGGGFGPALGAANIAVVLDDQRVVRTDAQGRFAFRFIAAGRHTVAIDQASLPRGTQASTPLTSVQLGGGQLAQLVLGIGAFGSIFGSVHGSDANESPIVGVLVVLDANTRATTDAHGAFAFGGLSAGKHTVAIVPESFPATFNVAGPVSQAVPVATGESTRIAFVGAPLGSIAGRVVFDSGAARAGQGILNAYVVANPGDHAAITGDDGSYLMDNLPPGTYTLTVDAETLGEGLAVTSETPVTVKLPAAGHVEGIDYRIGAGEKDVVFTFNGKQSNIVRARSLTKRLPPGAVATIVVTTTSPASSVTLSAFETIRQLVYRASDKTWLGSVHVPARVAAGTYSVGIEALGKTSGTTDVALIVDPSIPIVTLALDPINPVRGQYVHVRAHFLVDVHAEDKILWQDGTVTILPKPRAGRYYEFDVRVGTVPFSGALVTQSGQLPIVLVR